MKRLAALVAAILIFGGFCVWWFSPTQVLKRRTRDLCQILTLDAGTAPASRTINSLQFDRLLQPNVEFDIPSISEANGNFDRIEINSAFTWLCNNAKETKFRLVRFDRIVIEGGHASVSARLEARVLLPGAQVVDSPGDATFIWKKTEDGWRLEKAGWRE